MILNHTHREQLVQFLNRVDRTTQKFLGDPRQSPTEDLPTTSTLRLNADVSIEVMCVAPNRFMLHAGGRMNRAKEVSSGYAWVTLELRYRGKTVDSAYIDLGEKDSLLHALASALRAMCVERKALPPGTLGVDGHRRLDTLVGESGAA